MLLALAACGGDSDTVAGADPPSSGTPDTPQEPDEPGCPEAPAAKTLRVGILPDTQGGNSGVALHTR